MTSRPTQSGRRGSRRSPARRSGSVIIFAVGVLVLLAVLAAVFLTTSQQQRETGTSTVVQHMTTRTGAGAQRSIDHIAQIISRDVFDPMTPETMLAAPPIVPTAPSAFEMWDYPYTRQTITGAPTIGRPEFFNKGGDDPWLAEIDPRPDPDYAAGVDAHGLPENPATYTSEFSTWINLSKIHPLGTFVRIGYDDAAGQYTDDPKQFGIIDATTNPELGDPREPDGSPANAPGGMFIAFTPADPPTPDQEYDRQFADTDGDGHYDARWTRWGDWYDVDKNGAFDPLVDVRLSPLGDLPGVTTYIAARIIDLSGMINVNTATSFATGAGPTFAPVAPSDVDLLRFLDLPDYAVFDPAYVPLDGDFAFDAIMSGLMTGGGERVATGLNYDLIGLYSLGTYYLNSGSGANYARLRAYDSYHGRSLGVSRSTSSFASPPFHIDDELELRTYAARNDPASQSRLELLSDVPPLGGSTMGPLRSDRDDEVATRDELNSGNQLQRIQQYMVDLRHRLTTVSRARRLGNQTGRLPTLYFADGSLDRTAYPLINTKAPLPARNDVDMPLGVEYERAVTDYFKAMAKALAPFAVIDEGIDTWDPNEAPTFDVLAYGWDLLPDSTTESTEQFAVRTAAHLAVNAMDLFAGPVIDGTQHRPPRGVRLAHTIADDNPLSVDAALHPALTLGDLGMTIAPDPNHIQGNLETWIFGQTPHPYLVEAAAVVLYEDAEGLYPGDSSDWDFGDGPPPPGQEYAIGGSEEEAYKALYVELRNPYEDMSLHVYDESWPEPQFELRVSDDPDRAVPIKGVQASGGGNNRITLGPRGSGTDIVILEVTSQSLRDDSTRLEQVRKELNLLVNGTDAPDNMYTLDLPVGGEFWSNNHDRVELWQRIHSSTVGAYMQFILADVMETEGGSAFPLDPNLSANPINVWNDQDAIGYEAYIQRNAEDVASEGLPAFVIESTENEGKHSEALSNDSTLQTDSRPWDEYINDWLADPNHSEGTEIGQRDKSNAPDYTSREPIQLFSFFEQSGNLLEEQLLRVGDFGLVPAVGPEALPPQDYTTDPDWYRKSQYWRTASQQLARTVLEEDSANEVPLYELPGPDMLQFTRSVVDGYPVDTNPTTRADQIMPALPVALRIFDAVDFPFGTNRLQYPAPNQYPKPALMEPLAGQININTAPYEVIRMLPFAEDQAMQPNHDLAATIVDYRDRRHAISPFFVGMLGFPVDPLIGPFREDVHGVEGARDEPGFVSLGELLMLRDGTLTGAPGAIDYMARGGNELSPEYDLTDDDVSNDAEEERLIFSALSNLVTVRSDTFCVYLKVRGYRDGDRIDTPSIEERWVAVIDRSNVVLPGDKARIVFMQRVE